MTQPDLLDFCGKDLTIRGKPRRDGSLLHAELESDQSGTALQGVKDVEAISTTARRMLLAHGVFLTADHVEWKPGNMLHVDATFECIEPEHERILDLMRERSVVAKPFFLHGHEPLSADRVNFALRQKHAGFMTKHHQQTYKTSYENLHLDESNLDQTVFDMLGTPGVLKYYQDQTTGRRMKKLEDRLRMKPDQTRNTVRPVWYPSEGFVEPGRLVSLQHGIRSDFLSLLLKSQRAGHTMLLHAQEPLDHRKAIVFDQQQGEGESEMVTLLRHSFIDRRGERMILPDDTERQASHLLTSYDEAKAFIDTLRKDNGGDAKRHVAAYVMNDSGMNSVRDGNRDWVEMDGKETPRQRLEILQEHLPTKYLPKSPAETGPSTSASPVIRLLNMAKTAGLDAGGVMVSDTFPPGASLDRLVATRGYHTLLFRSPAAGEDGPYFSNWDFNCLQQLLKRDVRILWMHEDIDHPIAGGGYEKGTMLQFTQIPGKDSWAFVPIDRVEDFQRGFHLVCYGTSGKLEQEAVDFTDTVLAILARRRNGTPIIVHSGGGPDLSAMGIANSRARKYGFLSIGHALGVSREPINASLDGVIPFRKGCRDVRQGNMAAGGNAFLSLPGGGGTRQERGTGQADIATGLCEAIPIIMADATFHRHEWLQHLVELSSAMLSDRVMRCESVIDLSEPEKAAEIILACLETGEVHQSLPPEFAQELEQAKREYLVSAPKRRSF